MTITIYCSMGGHRGRPIEVGPGKPVRIRVRSSETGAGMVSFSEENGRCHFTFEGDAEARHNGISATAGTMGENDRLEVGRMSFQVQLATTPIFAGGPTVGTAVDAEDGRRTDELPVRPGDAAGAEADETKAHLEVHTDRYRAQTSALKVDTTEQLREQTATVPIPGRAVHLDAEEQEETVSMASMPGPSPAAEGDAADGGRRRRKIEAREETEAVDERRRRVRRISASQDSVVPEAAGKQGRGILKKMAKMFKRTDQQAGRLRELLDERDALFRESGRLSLVAGGGMGLPEDLVTRLLQGETVTLDEAVLNTVELQRYAERCKLLSLLEAEIYALRDEMGMSVPERDLPGDEKLRTERQDFEERAFQASDIVLTQDLEGMEGEEDPSATDSYASGDLPEGRREPPEKQPPPEKAPPAKKDLGKAAPGESRVSGRRRAMRRRRRR